MRLIACTFGCLTTSIKKLFLLYRLGLARMTFLKLFRVIVYVYRTKILRVECPGAIIIGLTYRCQCKCVHCSVGLYSVEPEHEMSVDKIKSLLNQIVKLNIPKVNFFGGEPLLRGRDLVALVQYGNDLGLHISVDTNGIALAEGFSRELKEAGINNINISVDSADRNIHDNLRGFEGAFDSAMTAIKNCLNERIPCVISTYASKRAIYSGDLNEIITLGRRMKVSAVKILLPIMSGRWAHSECERLSQEERKKVNDMLDPGFVYLESPLFSVKSDKKICEALDKKMVYISPHGDVQACYAVPFSFGNINNEALHAILARMWSSEFFCKIGNDHECVMNNPHFRKIVGPELDKASGFPINYQKIDTACQGCTKI